MNLHRKGVTLSGRVSAGSNKISQIVTLKLSPLASMIDNYYAMALTGSIPHIHNLVDNRITMQHWVE